MRSIVLLLAATVLSAAVRPSSSAAQGLSRRPAVGSGFAPKVRSYDPVTDTFTYHSSVLSPVPKRGAGAYYGNRMKEYQFLGARHEKGFYGALEDRYRRLQHDPDNYRYRFGKY
jgi:hypothetical protein